jgi:PAS domain S-box-containing protein
MTLNVLIVDDSLTVRMDLVETFGSVGLETVACASAEEARKVLAEDCFSLVVMDVLLPDGDGIEILRTIRETPSTSDLPVILLSTESEVRDRIRGLTTGADDYIGKPYDRNYLIARARELLSLRPSATVDAGYTVLIIEDSVTFRAELKSALEESSYRVLTAATGEEGLRVAAGLRPDAIIVDGVLPGIDGATVVRRIRLDTALRRLPCLLLTASDDRGAEVRALDAGADAFVKKGEEVTIILARLAAMRRSAGSQDANRGTASLLAPKKVLAADDSETYLQELAGTLRSNGYEAILARSGEETLELLAVQPVDCILLDILMPGIGGQETCRRIKSAPAVRGIPIIMLTALEDREAMIEGLGAGADDYVAKSSDFEVLHARMLAQIRRKQFEDEHRLVQQRLLRSELEATEARAATRLAETRGALVEEVERKNRELQILNETLERRVIERTENLDRAQRHLGAVIAASPIAIYMLDQDGRVALWNASAERVFGYTEDEAMGRLPPPLIEGHLSEFRDRQAGMAEDSSATGSLETQKRRKDGKIIDVQLCWARVNDQAGNMLGSMYAVADITERKKLEAQLQQSQKMEAIGRLTGGMAHDFNNLLGIIIGNIDLLRSARKDDPEADELAHDALDAALRGADLARRLLAFARQQPLKPQRVDVNELVIGITKLLRRTLGEHIGISLDLSAEVCPIVADPAQLEASLTNLATNARDAMPHGGRLIFGTGNRHLDSDFAAQHTEVIPGEYAMIEVSDTGSGMPPAVTSQIFEPFFTTKEPGKGTGLGLSMVFGFIKQSGGHISVYSEPGTGTTFRLFFPRATGNVSQTEAIPSAELARGEGETILAVEDNAALRRVVIRQLGELGYRALEAEDAACAQDLMERESVDLLLTDIILPGGIDGVELARWVSRRWPLTKVVFTSGFPEARLNDDNGSLIPGVALLGKPYRKEDLAKAIRDALTRSAR